ncbi:MAG: hypothetical protein JNM85_06995 [Chthonomonas sp.]|nr:hypothetical protein [Chthonomonas sp.]
MIKVRFALLSSLLATSCLAPAAVTGYSVSYLRNSVQNSDFAPVLEDLFAFQAIMSSDGTGEFDAGEFNAPNGTVTPLIFSPPAYLIYGEYQPTLGALFTSYPTGTYTFKITGGSFAGQSATVATSAADFANSIPFLTSGSYSSLQFCNAGDDRTVTWPAFTHSGVMPLTTSALNVLDMTSTNLAWQDGGPASVAGSTTIPGAKLISGHYYYYGLTHDCYRTTSNAGFGTAAASVTYTRRSEGYFQVQANPGTVAGQFYHGQSNRSIGIPVTVEVVQGGVLVDTQTFAVGYNNWYAFDTTATGTADLYFKSSHWLKKAVYNVDLDTGHNQLDVTLQNGDCNDDNHVDFFDYLQLSDAYESVVGDPTFSAGADLSEDGEVNFFDYLIMSANYETDGDDY